MAQDNPTTSDEVCTPEYADAPFCGGPSDPTTRDFDDVSMLTGCGTDGPYFEVATGSGSFALEFDGEQVDAWTVEPEDLSELGLHTVGYQLPDNETDVAIYRDGTLAASALTNVGCAPAADPTETAVAETTEPAPPPAEQLPVTGIETSLALTGAMLLAVGASILRAVR